MGSWLCSCTFVLVWWCDVGELVEAHCVLWIVGMVVVERQPLFVVNHATTGISEFCRYTFKGGIV